MDWDLTLRATQSLVAAVGLIAVWRTLHLNQQTLQNNQRTLQQRILTDDRETWWKRFEWAYEQTQSEDADIRDAGFSVLAILEESALAGENEGELIMALARSNVRRMVKDPRRLRGIRPFNLDSSHEEAEPNAR